MLIPNMTRGETIIALRLEVEMVDVDKDAKALDPTIGVVDPIETREEVVNSLMVA